MSNDLLFNDDRVLDCPDQAPNWASLDRRRCATVEKIVIGQLSGDAKNEPLSIGTLPTDLVALFPKLTHLYLWNCAGFTALPALPAGLKCLEVRGCAEVKTLGELPHEQLEELCLWHLPQARELFLPPRGQPWPKLRTMILRGCRELSEGWLTMPGQKAGSLGPVLACLPEIRHFEVTDCEAVISLPGPLPKSLRRLSLSGCTKLRQLPREWPKDIQRLELRGTAIQALPQFPLGLDYVDIGATRSLSKLPGDVHWAPRTGLDGAIVRRPRTLYLHGSALQQPPVSEHGAKPEENVAEPTRGYFLDLELFGQGEVRQCKVHFLGDGGAGKTALSLNLQGRDPGEADTEGSTHGVRFAHRDVEDGREGIDRSIRQNFWDFGGQEIYHQTHWHFMGTGTLFVVLWHRKREVSQFANWKCGYQDQPRPLRYWLEMIRMQCAYVPRIAVVCSREHEETNEAREAFAEATKNLDVEPELFFIDSRAFKDGGPRGQKDDLSGWLDRETRHLVSAQGDRVPIHWQVAHELVNTLVANDPRTRVRTLKPDEFLVRLETAVREDQRTATERLRNAVTDGAEGAVLGGDRLRRVLAHLMHTGAVYWNPNLFEGRVIIDQTWALEGIYAILDRTHNSTIYAKLESARGRFTRRELADWAWSNYSEDEQQLFLSVMEEVRVIFALMTKEESMWDEALYVSVAHLPLSEAEANAHFNNPAALTIAPEVCEMTHLHVAEWNRYLARLGREFGRSAFYWQRGFYLPGEGDLPSIRIELSPYPSNSGIGADVTFFVAGPDRDKAIGLRKKLVAALREPSQQELANTAAEPPVNESGIDEKPSRNPYDRPRIFISYKWNIERDGTIVADYETAAKGIYTALERENRWRILGDVKLKQAPEDYLRKIKDWMKYNVAKADRFILIHGDAYWTSVGCMYELVLACNSCADTSDKSLTKFLILVGHPDSKMFTHVMEGGSAVDGSDAYRRFWRSELAKGTASGSWAATFRLDEYRDFLDQAPSAIVKVRDLGQSGGIRLELSKLSIEEVIRKIKTLLEAPVPRAE